MILMKEIDPMIGRRFRFWDSEGLKTVAELIRAEEIKRGSRSEIAEVAGYSSQTIFNLMKNLNNYGGEIIKEPHPDTLLNLAVAITNPDTGQPFDPEELIKVARGLVRLRSREWENQPLYMLQELPYPAAVRELWRLIGDRTIDRAAQDWGIDSERLRQLLESKDPTIAMPRLTEVWRIVSKSYPDRNANRLMQFYVGEQQQPPNGSK
jgi:DNA-binding CsgD family transcriptional regulator